jgi:hypothetical protein
MIVVGGTGWLTTLADLSLILFMVTASALSQADAADTSKPQAIGGAPMIAEPVAIFRPDGKTDSLKQWLANQPADPRQRMTIRVSYAAGGEVAAAERALQVAQEAREIGRDPRIVMESGKASDITVSLAYDSDPADMAQQLHSAEQSNGPEKKP